MWLFFFFAFFDLPLHIKLGLKQKIHLGCLYVVKSLRHASVEKTPLFPVGRMFKLKSQINGVVDQVFGPIKVIAYQKL